MGCLGGDAGTPAMQLLVAVWCQTGSDGVDRTVPPRPSPLLTGLGPRWESGVEWPYRSSYSLWGLGSDQRYRRAGFPTLGEGRVAGVAFLVVCGLVGMVFALVALHVYEIVRQLDSASSLGVGDAEPDVIANGLLATLRDIGPILGIAAAVDPSAPAPAASDRLVSGRGEPGYSAD